MLLKMSPLEVAATVCGVIILLVLILGVIGAMIDRDPHAKL